jgi:hypothetical protein
MSYLYVGTVDELAFMLFSSLLFGAQEHDSWSVLSLIITLLGA